MCCQSTHLTNSLPPSDLFGAPAEVMIVTQGDKEEEGFTEKKNDCSIGQCAHLQEGDGYHWGEKMSTETNL